MKFPIRSIIRGEEAKYRATNLLARVTDHPSSPAPLFFPHPR